MPLDVFFYIFLAGRESKLIVLTVVVAAAMRLWEVDPAAAYRKRQEVNFSRPVKEAIQRAPSRSRLSSSNLHLTVGLRCLLIIVGDAGKDLAGKAFSEEKGKK